MAPADPGLVPAPDAAEPAPEEAQGGAVTYSLLGLKLSTRVPVKELGAAIAYSFV
jgi:hypothetical protein